MLGIAIIGAGAIANVHADAFLQHKDRCQVRVVSDLFVEKAQEMIDSKGLTGAVACKDYQDVILRDDIDVVAICLPPKTHCEVAVAALEAGKHVLVEKPMATSLEECDKMIEAARKSGKLLSPVAQNRYKTPNHKVHELLESKQAGRPLHITVNSLWWRGPNYYDIWWRGTWDTECGGCVTSHAVHHLDLLQWFVGMPKSVTAVISNVGHDNSECEDVGIAIFEYEGMLAQLTVSLVSHDEEADIILQTDKARVSVPWKPVSSKPLPNGFPQPNQEAVDALQSAYDALPELGMEGHPAQIGNFLRAIAGEEELLIDGVEGRKTMELIMAIYKASVTRTPVTLPIKGDDPFYRHETMAAQMPHFHEKTRSIENFADNTITLGRDVGR